MAQIGSTRDIISQSNTGLFDELGNSVVSGDTSFAASPLGIAARSQALYGIPNPNFNLTPPDPNSAIDNEANPLPYWTIENESSGVMTATSIFDATTETYAVQLDPGTAAIDSTLTLTTRSYLITDDNLSLRQLALAVLEKSGTAGTSTSQWNLQLSATYYSSTGSALSTAIIGTALDTGTWTSFSGTTTPGGSAINSAAQYVDLSFKMTATAAVTGSAKATIKSLLLTTSTPAAGGGSFLIAETFTSSGTWTRPTGVDYLVAVVAVGAGGGGGGGPLHSANPISGSARSGGGGGGGANWAAIREVYVGDVGSVSVGIGAGGAGGLGTTFIKAAGGASSDTLDYFGTNGAAGGATTFGTYLSVPGGGGGTAGSTASKGGGTAGASATLTVLNNSRLAGAAGGSSFGTAAAGTGFAGSATAFVQLTYTPVPVAGAAGASATGTANTPSTTVLRGTFGAGGSAGFGAGGGGGGGAQQNGPTAYAGAAGGVGGGGGGGGGLHIFISGTATPGTSGNATGTAGNGGDGAAYAGAGGGGGGALLLQTSASVQYTQPSFTLKSGSGGSGSGGVVYVIYIA